MLNWIEMELIICIKMDLALNNLQRLICHKTLTNKQTNIGFCEQKNKLPKRILTQITTDRLKLMLNKNRIFKKNYH